MTRPTQPIGTVILVAALMAAQVCLAQANRESPAAVEPSPVIKEAFQRASELLEAGKMQEAVELLDSTADEAGQTPEADQIRYASIQILGFSFQMEGKNKEALEQHAEVFLEKGSDEIKEAIYLQSGGIFKLTGNYERSRQTLDRYLEEFPPPTEQELEEFAERMRAAGEEAAAGTIQHPRIVARQIAERMLDDISFMGKEAPHFEVLGLAPPTGIPAVPDRKRTVLLSAVVGLLVAVFLAFVLEYFERNRRSGRMEPILDELRKDLERVRSAWGVRAGRRRKKEATPLEALARRRLSRTDDQGRND